MRAFDVRAVTKEQVESMGATFLEVPIQEDGAGAGGYAKVRQYNEIHLIVQFPGISYLYLSLIVFRKCPISTKQHKHSLCWTKLEM